MAVRTPGTRWCRHHSCVFMSGSHRFAHLGMHVNWREEMHNSLIEPTGSGRRLGGPGSVLCLVNDFFSQLGGAIGL
jgi:hypothetical protein